MSAPPRLQAPTLAAVPGLEHGFFGRLGGVSTGIYASLNCGPGSGDDLDAVRENRARVAHVFGAAPDRLLSLHQVHSARAVIVVGPWSGERPQADGMAAATPGLALGVLAADCAPVLFADAEAGVIGAAHAGWKGALAGVLEATVEAMARLGARADRIVAAIGPCIAFQSYEVGPEFEALFLARDPASSSRFGPGPAGRAHFDLSGYCADRLHRAGILSVDRLDHDTLTRQNELFSHRRSRLHGEADYGRNISVISWAP